MEPDMEPTGQRCPLLNPQSVSIGGIFDHVGQNPVWDLKSEAQRSLAPKSQVTCPKPFSLQPPCG